MSDQDLTDIKVALARIEERQDASLHKARNMDMKIDAIGERFDRYAEKVDLQPLERRVDNLESNQRWVTRTAIAIFVSVGGGLYALGKKLGLI